MNLKTSTKFEIVICIIGFLLLIYPFVSNYWNTRHAASVIITYDESLSNINAEEYAKLKEEAERFNEHLASKKSLIELSKEEKEWYNSLLNIDGNGNIGYLDIDVINVHLPIYHGISDNVLQNSVGHLEWSSLPIGGESSHVVVSAHRGLKSARLFTDLHRLEIGDRFVINVLKEKLTYEVDQIRVVKPEDLSYLKIIDGEDLVTLVTCTPYGVNTERLLVRGHRVIGKETFKNIVANGELINKYLVALFISIISILIFIISTFKKTKNKN